ncbi:hypothetical protein BBK82_03115 [Lentzea guizhouensis]|uniref:DUF6292 domain-containing protein n=1 Tax=Lentzea guizhouensis TaxID=1586287 RepID=A0A1B2HBV3_9PSEU|nr:DUF6292 family protein [Lentzea guizhouensis]ANZ35207.1 hypothetical protein BBK82_03115 [Lentzea guizhouensis]
MSSESPTTETDIQEAHKPYIERVIWALNDAGIPTPDHEVHRDDPRSAYIQLGETDPNTGREIGLVWHEESGWYRGIDQAGSGELNLIRWMHDLLPTPGEVAAWVRAMETDATKHGGIERPRFRDFDDTDDGFEAELAEAGAE